MWHILYLFFKFFTNKLLAHRFLSPASPCFFLFDMMLEIGHIVQMSLRSEFLYPFPMFILSQTHLHRNKGNHKTREPRARNYTHVYDDDIKNIIIIHCMYEK